MRLSWPAAQQAHQPDGSLRALLHLPSEPQGRTKEYLRQEFEAFPPDKCAHIGWQGAALEATSR